MAPPIVLIVSIRENTPNDAGENNRDSSGAVATRAICAAMLPEVRMPTWRASGRRDSFSNLCAIRTIQEISQKDMVRLAVTQAPRRDATINSVGFEFAAHHGACSYDATFADHRAIQNAH